MDRKKCIADLEKERGSKLIVYFMSDRQPFNTRIAGDVVPIFNKHLSKIGQVKKISLFLYTTGGDMLAPIRIVKLIRNHCQNFEVLIPYKAHSAGTLIALGADCIVMGKLGELTPVDPTTGHPFNPQHPTNLQQKLEIGVEDLNSYFLLAKEKAGIKDEQMAEVFRLLVEKLHPLSLGNAYRAYRMARMLTERLLTLHMDKKQEKAKIQRIIKAITGDNITIHAYPIDRDEAKDLGLRIEKAQGDEKFIDSLFASYSDYVNLNKPFNPEELLNSQDANDFEKVGAFIESYTLCDCFCFQGKASRVIRNNQPDVDIRINMQSWLEKKI